MIRIDNDKNEIKRIFSEFKDEIESNGKIFEYCLNPNDTACIYNDPDYRGTIKELTELINLSDIKILNGIGFPMKEILFKIHKRGDVCFDKFYVASVYCNQELTKQELREILDNFSKL